MKLTDTWQFWIAMITLGLALIGAVTGVVSLRRQTVMGERSARAAERSADEAAEANKHGMRAADEAEKATHASVRSADSADISAGEARTITRIEAGRRHDELGPSVSVRFIWRPSQAGGQIYALVKNTGQRDLLVLPVQEWETGGETTLSDTVLYAGHEKRIAYAQFRLGQLGQLAFSPSQWDDRLNAFGAQDNVIRNELAAELERAGTNVGYLSLRYRSPDDCPCNTSPPSADYGHWSTRHYVTELDI
ncbi:hypothetical protein [Virgisporangium ochraceum]|uniref:hypothetical protein n=1 Tax=Virgisporangium ochraceum TaxID=65505 RepID=UPI001941AB9D|nr:hypothetical protein [Virgisporangium ochraceum]